MRFDITPEKKAAIMKVYEQEVDEDLKFPGQQLERGITDREVVEHFCNKVRTDMNAYWKYQQLSDEALYTDVSGKVCALGRGVTHFTRFGHQRTKDNPSRDQTTQDLRHDLKQYDRRD